MGEIVSLITPKAERYSQGKHINRIVRTGQWKALCRELEAYDVIKIVTKITGITLGQMRCARRVPHYVVARQLFAVLCIEHTKLSYPAMGRVVDRDHTTMMHLVKKERTDAFEKIYQEASEQIDQFKEKVFGPPVW